jgi:AcrR family transcriptional regulator
VPPKVHRGDRRGALARRARGDDPARLTPPTDIKASLKRLFRETAGAEPPSERHMEVLREALKLFAERGYGGASLRELARRLGVQQPSLYHYFETKEQLLEQVIVHVGSDLLTGFPEVIPPEDLEDVPAFAVAGVMVVWENPLYAAFVKLLFTVSGEQPRARKAMEILYNQGARVMSAAFLEPFIARGEIAREEGYVLIRTALNSIAMMYLEEQLLYGRTKPSAELRAHAVETERWLRDAVRQRRK